MAAINGPIDSVLPSNAYTSVKKERWEMGIKNVFFKKQDPRARRLHLSKRLF